MVLRILAVAMVSVAALQEPADEIARAILRLSNDDAQVRAKAEADLLAFGAKAIPALREASQTVGALTRERANRILVEIERIEFEKIRDAENRKKVIPFETNDGNLRNTYRFEVEGGRYKAAVYTDKGGLALYSSFTGYPTQFVFDIVAVTDAAGKKLDVERCGTCSPTWVHVRSPGPVRVKYAGIRRWFSEYPVVFENPKEGEQKRIGNFVITVKWPELVVSSSASWSPDALQSTARFFDFKHKDPDRNPPVRHGGRFSGKFPPRHTTWCMCEGGPKPLREPEPLVNEILRVKYAHSDIPDLVMPDLKDVARIELSFSKPVEESFEVESPDIKTSEVLGER